MGNRRKDLAALLRQIERPVERGLYMGVASSIDKDGKFVNGQNFNDGEVRDLLFALPYGISSSGIDGIRIQIIKNNNKNNVAVGVIDKNKPPVKSGCIIIYDKFGSSISLNGDGSITIKAKTIDINTQNINLDGNININGNVAITGNATLNGKQIATF